MSLSYPIILLSNWCNFNYVCTSTILNGCSNKIKKQLTDIRVAFNCTQQSAVMTWYKLRIYKYTNWLALLNEAAYPNSSCTWRRLHPPFLVSVLPGGLEQLSRRIRSGFASSNRKSGTALCSAGCDFVAGANLLWEKITIGWLVIGTSYFFLVKMKITKRLVTWGLIYGHMYVRDLLVYSRGPVRCK